MRTGSLTSWCLLWTVVVMLGCCAVAPASAYTPAECEAQFTCGVTSDSAALVSVTGVCLCCAVDINGAATTNCAPAVSIAVSDVSLASTSLASTSVASTLSASTSVASTSSASTSVAACVIPNCLACATGSTSECATCEDGYALSSDSASCVEPTTTEAPVTCEVAHCTACASGNATACATCNDGYYPSDGLCVLDGTCTVTNCAQCMLKDMTKCSICRSGYALTTSFMCALNKGGNGTVAPHSLGVAAAVAFVMAAVAFSA